MLLTQNRFLFTFEVAVFFVLAVPISGGPDVRLEISPQINMWQDDLGSWRVLLLNSMLWSFLFEENIPIIYLLVPIHLLTKEDALISEECKTCMTLISEEESCLLCQTSSVAKIPDSKLHRDGARKPVQMPC